MTQPKQDQKNYLSFLIYYHTYFFSEIDLYNFDVTEVKVSVLKRRNSLKCCLTEAVFLLSLSSLSESSVLSLVLSEDEGTGVQMDNGFCIMQKVAYFIIIHFVRQ